MYKVTATLLTPIILSPDSHLTLDSVLHHALMDLSSGDSALALSKMPLEKVGSVFAASAAFFPLSAHYATESCFGGLKNNDITIDKIKPNDRKKGWRQVKIANNDDGIKPLLSEYQSIDSSKLVWFANGDPDKIQSLLESLIGLGKRYTNGHGQIGEIRIDDMDNDHSIALADGTPARPIPIEEWRGNKDGLRQEYTACLPPYYTTGARHCALHTTRFINI